MVLLFALKRVDVTVFGIPTAIILYFSVLKKGAYGGIQIPPKYSLASYKLLFESNDILKIVIKTLNLSIIMTIVTLILALPTAYFISRSKYKNLRGYY